VTDAATDPDALPLELEALANGDYAELKRVTSVLIKRMTKRMAAESPAEFARAIQNGR
jgi:hypothetical protein